MRLIPERRCGGEFRVSDDVNANEAIRSLYELYADDVYRFARLTLGDATGAKDVVQEVFLRAFRSWASFRQNSNARTWLMSIARNYMYSEFRKKRTERKWLVQNVATEAVDDSSAKVESMMMWQDALSRVPESYRQVFILRHVQNYSVHETVEILGWSESKVKKTDQRAIAKLRDIFNSNDREVTPIDAR